MRESLALALQNYSGAMLIVSHDRHLLETVCDEFFLVSSGTLSTFDGDLADYQAWLKSSSKTTFDNKATRMEPALKVIARLCGAGEVNGELRRPACSE